MIVGSGMLSRGYEGVPGPNIQIFGNASRCDGPKIEEGADQGADHAQEHKFARSLGVIIPVDRSLTLISRLLSLFFKLFRVKVSISDILWISPYVNVIPLTHYSIQDKALRTLLHNHIITDIKGINKKQRNNRINNALQNFLFNIMQDPNNSTAKKAHEIMIELYKRKVWYSFQYIKSIHFLFCSGLMQNL